MNRSALHALFLTILFFANPDLISAAQNEAVSDAELVFDSQHYDVAREGYVTLKWSAINGATGYRVIGADSDPVYDGHFTQAFLSGLSDGTYEYRVQAIASDGSIITTSTPTKVTVHHWSLQQALVLFGIGMIVVFCVVLVIYCGARLSGKEALQS